MIGFVALIGAWLAWTAKALAAKMALLIVVIGVVTGVILVTKTAMLALIAAVPYTSLPADVSSAAGALMPSQFRPCMELLISARLAVIVFQSKWLYLRMYMWAAGWKFI